MLTHDRLNYNRLAADLISAYLRIGLKIADLTVYGHLSVKPDFFGLCHISYALRVYNARICGHKRTTTYHIAVRMKNSSMNTAPKGRIPPIKIDRIGLMYHTCSGIWRGIWLVRTGSSGIYKKKIPLIQ